MKRQAHDASRKPARRLSPGEYEILAEFRRSLRQFLQFSEQEALRIGLTPRQHQALLAIHGFSRRAPVTIRLLSQFLGLRHHSVVGLVDRLEAQKLVRRSHGSPDRRTVQLQLTERGRDMLDHLSAVHKNELKRIAPHLEYLLQTLTVSSRRRNA